MLTESAVGNDDLAVLFFKKYADPTFYLMSP